METLVTSEFEARYKNIEEANSRSFYMNDADRPFDVVMSVHSAGSEHISAKENPDVKDAEVFTDKTNKAARYILGGNMSTVQQPSGNVPYGPKHMTNEERLEDARKNMARHFEATGIDPAKLLLLFPERDYSKVLTAVNADEDTQEYNSVEPRRLAKSGDFVYSYNPNIILGVRPADCPVVLMSADTPKGPVNIMVHYAWRGVAFGQLEATRKQLEAMEVDFSTIKAYVTPGGHAETYKMTNFMPDEAKQNPVPVENDLFVNVKESRNDEGKTVYSFGVDTPNAVYKGLMSWGLKPEQVFADTTDTVSPDSGASSHSRSTNYGIENTRDLVTVQFHAKN